jgi:UDP-glucose:(heptosyl)LPS alpha-1,3-glucosyltransferase
MVGLRGIPARVYLSCNEGLSWGETDSSMRLALAITSLFPTGGLQRDCLAIARILAADGHEVTVITSDYRQPVDLGDLKLEVWPGRSLTKAGRIRGVAARLAAARGRFDRIVGFNKIPGIDVYYCADPPFAEIRSHRLSRLWPATDARVRLEGEVFGPASATSVLVVSDRQVEAYRKVWETPASRFRVVPPSLPASRRNPGLRRTDRDRIRNALGIPGAQPVWLAIASVPRTKGVDRTVKALAAEPEATLLVAGTRAGSREARRIMGWAGEHGLDDRVRVLGYREDIPELMAAADLLVHPARMETTGTAILEAIANGLPAIVTAACGYAAHVARAEAGIVLSDPFLPEHLAAALVRARDPDLRRRWSENGIAYGAQPALGTGLRSAADAIVGPLWS